MHWISSGVFGHIFLERWMLCLRDKRPLLEFFILNLFSISSMYICCESPIILLDHLYRLLYQECRKLLLDLSWRTLSTIIFWSMSAWKYHFQSEECHPRTIRRMWQHSYWLFCTHMAPPYFWWNQIFWSHYWTECSNSEMLAWVHIWIFTACRPYDHYHWM